MPQLEYFLVAESCSVDVNRNSLSIFHVLNDIRIDSFPGFIHEMVAISGWLFSGEEIENRNECQLRIEFNIPGQESKSFRGNLPAEVRFQNYNFGIGNVPVSEAGDIVVRLYLDDQVKATHTMSVSDEITD